MLRICLKVLRRKEYEVRNILNMVSLTVASFVACWGLMCFIESETKGGMPSTTADDAHEDRPKIAKESRKQQNDRKRKEKAVELFKKNEEALSRAAENELKTKEEIKVAAAIDEAKKTTKEAASNQAKVEAAKIAAEREVTPMSVHQRLFDEIGLGPFKGNDAFDDLYKLHVFHERSFGENIKPLSLLEKRLCF